MTSCLSKLKVTPSFCFSFKIPDDLTATIISEVLIMVKQVCTRQGLRYGFENRGEPSLDPLFRRSWFLPSSIKFLYGRSSKSGYYLIDLTKKTLTANFTYNSQICPHLAANFRASTFGYGRSCKWELFGMTISLVNNFLPSSKTSRICEGNILSQTLN